MEGAGVSVFSGESRVVQLHWLYYGPQITGVSVFSGESRVVQQPSFDFRQTAYRCFSILWRISCGATYKLEEDGSLSHSFSILWRISCGATNPQAIFIAQKRLFQYSLANLVWCNKEMIKLLAAQENVSVFSGESRVVQLY